MNTPRPQPRPASSQAAGAAVTGALLAYGACQFFSWTRHHSNQACQKTDGLCFTWWDVAVIPLSFTTALIVLTVVYKRLGIRPLIAVIPPTLLLAPLPLIAAQTTAGWWAVTITGATWSFFVALTAWSRYRILGISMSVALLLAALIALYH
ncbi:hypothetical protein ACQB60_40615 [Actinomycetota bacterium Odt1-20B]